jgi:hypothetical protein
MQRQKAEFDTALTQFAQLPGVKMQAGRRRSNGARLAREDSLIANPVDRIIGTLDIGRQWHMTVFIQHPVNRLREVQYEKSITSLCDGRHHAAVKFDLSAHDRRTVRPELHERVIGIELSFKQHLDFTAACFTPAQPCRDNLGIVHNKQVAGLEQATKSGDPQILTRTIVRRHMQQPTRRPVGQWLLRDLPGRQIEMKFIRIHGRKGTGQQGPQKWGQQ